MSSAACDICYEDYDSHEAAHRPRTLPCGHTICCGCLGRLLQLAGASRSCPTCRRFAWSTDPESYPRNYALEAVLDSLRDRFFADTAGSELDADTLRITEEILGEGGTGMVKAGELRLGQVTIKVAVKMLATQGADTATLQRFKQEIKGTISAARTCSLVCRVLGYCIKDQRLCLVMLRYAGSLVSLVSGQGFSQEKAFRATLQLAKGLQELHDVRILHLDIKPQNVLVDRHGDVAVSDFGISQQMQHTLSRFIPSNSMAMLGSPNYMAPEAVSAQGSGLQLGFAADVWSFAATAVYILTKSAPYSGQTVWQIINALTAQRLPPTIAESVPAALRGLLLRCFAFEPEARPKVHEVVQQLQVMQEQLRDGMANGAEAASEGRCSAMLAQLQSNIASTQQRAAQDIQSLSPSEMGAIVAAGALPLLVSLLRLGEPAVQQHAAYAICKVASGSQQNKDAIIAAGALPPLVTLLRSDKPAVLEMTAAALCNLADGSQQNKNAIIAAGALPPLVTLLRSDKPAVLEQTAAALCSLANSSQQNKDAIIAAGALPLLVTLLRSDKPAVQRLAASALWGLACGTLNNQDAIVSADALPSLIVLLGPHQPEVQVVAAGALCCLAQGCQQVRDVIIASNAVPQLLALLRSDQPDVQEAAAHAFVALDPQWRTRSALHLPEEIVSLPDAVAGLDTTLGGQQPAMPDEQPVLEPGQSSSPASSASREQPYATSTPTSDQAAFGMWLWAANAPAPASGENVQSGPDGFATSNNRPGATQSHSVFRAPGTRRYRRLRR